MKLAKADFYYGALLSKLINTKFAPAILEPGNNRRIYHLHNNSDYIIYAKYVSTPVYNNDDNGTKRWDFNFNSEEVQEILLNDTRNMFAFICGEENFAETEFALLTREQLQICFGIGNICLNITPSRRVTIRLGKRRRNLEVYGTGLDLKNSLKIIRNTEQRLQQFV